jgi:CelD/BcsL family acetyltransferase involved in cellulose biosynthesis
MLVPEPLTAADSPSWTALALAGGNVFGTAEWCETWWRHFGGRRPLRLTALRRPDGSLAAVLPLYRAACVPARVVRMVGHGAGDECGPVCAPADRAAALEALPAALGDWDVMLADDLLGGGRIEGARALGRRPSPVVRLPAGASWDDLLADRSRNFRREVRKRERRLARLGELRQRVATDPARLDDDLDAFLALHRARWGARSRAFAGRVAFHRDFAALALSRGWLRLRFLELDGRPMAALYNLRFAGAECSYQAGRDPAFDRFSAGFLLHVLAIRDALESGAREYRLLRGGEAYKFRLADADPGVETIGLARGRRGRVLLGALAAERSLPPTARRALPRGLAWGSGAAPLWGGA